MQKEGKKSTTDGIFALRMLIKKYREGAALCLEKAYDRVPREGLWYCMSKSGGAKKYVEPLVCYGDGQTDR